MMKKIFDYITIVLILTVLCFLAGLEYTNRKVCQEYNNGFAKICRDSVVNVYGRNEVMSICKDTIIDQGEK